MLAARHRLFEQVLALLTELAARSPFVLVLEDLHWADESSLCCSASSPYGCATSQCW
jgi:predicted ATPase